MRSILLFPHPKDMYGGEHHPEQFIRLRKTIEIWRRLRQNKQMAHILCSGGLPNKYGISLAEDMKETLCQVEPDVEKWIIIHEESSTHTGQGLYFNAEILHIFDEIITISNWWHLRGILCLLKHMDLETTIKAEASESYGNIGYRLWRAFLETIRYLMIATIDKECRFFDRSSLKRIRQAAQRP